jgi:hypothetical protein
VSTLCDKLVSTLVLLPDPFCELIVTDVFEEPLIFPEVLSIVPVDVPDVLELALAVLTTVLELPAPTEVE